MNTSRIAIAAALFLSGSAGINAAYAADLGGGCCADLEERVAELEATAARKGNRAVSLTIGGLVNRTLLTWDDGFDSDSYVVDSAHNSSRVNFKGEGKLDQGWKSGFYVEVEFRDNASNTVFQGDDEGIGDSGGGAIRIRHSNVYIDSERLGRVTLGQGNSAAKDINSISLVTNLDNANVDYAPAFRIRESDGDNTGLTWGQLASGLDGNRGDFVRYDSPSIAGFVLSAAWGEDDYWDVALRFKKEWNSIRLAAGIGYTSAENSATGGDIPEFEQVAGSISILHVPSGLFLNLAGGGLDSEALTEEASYAYGEFGISRKFMAYGATTIYAGYGRYEDFGAGVTGSNAISGVPLDAFTVASSEVTRYGAGIVQSFDAAALDIYAQLHYYEADITEAGGGSVDVENWMGVMTGMRIRF
jgi:predicted porin